MTANETMQTEFSSRLQRLSQLSIDGYYNPYNTFEWPASIADDSWWMSKDLLTVHGTRAYDELSEAQLRALSKWESINFYSLNIHGIRELLIETTRRIHMPGYEKLSQFLHHFVGEENEHMWFFAEFCWKYAGKLYPEKKIKDEAEITDQTVQDFLVFSRILLFEDIVDQYNLRMGKDESLAPIIRDINALHHVDESRHIAFGRQVVESLHGELRQRMAAEQLGELERYLKRYIVASMNSFYNPSVYRDAGIAEPYQLRARLLQDPARHDFHRRMLSRIVNFFVKTGIFTSDEIPHE